MIFPNIFISVYTPPWSSVLKDIFLTNISKYISVHTQQQSRLIISKYFPNNKNVFFQLYFYNVSFQLFLKCLFSDPGDGHLPSRTEWLPSHILRAGMDSLFKYIVQR